MTMCGTSSRSDTIGYAGALRSPHRARNGKILTKSIVKNCSFHTKVVLVYNCVRLNKKDVGLFYSWRAQSTKTYLPIAKKEMNSSEFLSYHLLPRTPAVKQPTMFLYPVQLPLIATQPNYELKKC